VRGRVWLSLSVALNLLLAVLLWRQFSPEPDAPLPAPSRDPTPEIQTIVRTNTIVRRQNFVWSDIESADYTDYIRNLRRIGCPESTIRDIIVADVNQLFLRRHATEIVTPQQQWWRSEADPEVTHAAATNKLALTRERRELLTQLLGPDWESAEYPFPSAYDLSPLDGPILGRLAPETKAAVHEIERSAQERLRTYLEDVEQAGEPADPAVLARLREESRSALGQILPPAALEEYLLRTSDLASELRDSLRGVEVTSEEFRAMFRALDPLRHDRRLESAPANATIDPSEQIAQLEKARQNALLEVLGEERYENLQLSRDALYQEASQIVAQAGVPDAQIVPVAAIVRLTQDELDRIRNDLLLTSEERLKQIQATRDARQASLRTLLGEEAYLRYLDTHPRLWDPDSP
jgi:hypothetical protein